MTRSPCSYQILRFVPGLLMTIGLAGCDDGSGGRSSSPVLDASQTAETAAETSTGYPAFVPPLPQVLNWGGRVLDTARIVPIVFSSDDPLVVAQLRAFTAKLPTTEYWRATVEEYGVGEVTVSEPVVVNEAAPAVISEVGIKTWLGDHVPEAPGTDDGSGMAFPPSDGHTIYIIFYPPGTSVTSPDGSSSCVDWGAYHDEAFLNNGTSTAMAVIPRCADYGGFQGLQFLTFATAHELIEAVTDPFIGSRPAYVDVDVIGAGWARVVAGGEVTDLCVLEAVAAYMPPEFDFLVPRSWSNTQAQAGHDPCVPHLPGDTVYFSAFPTLEFLRQPNLPYLSGVSVAPGTSKTVDVHLFSDGPTSGPWTLNAIEYQGRNPPVDAEKLLSFAWDRTTGSNGDIVHLTITRAVSQLPGPAQPLSFGIRSTLGAKTNTWWSTVFSIAPR